MFIYHDDTYDELIVILLTTSEKLGLCVVSSLDLEALAILGANAHGKINRRLDRLWGLGTSPACRQGP